MTGLNERPWRYWLFNFGLVVSFGTLTVTLINLSLIKGSYYQGLARDNKVVENKIPAERGQIIDRKGRVMAKSIYDYFKMDGDNKVYLSSGNFQGYKFEGKELSYDLERQYTYNESAGLVTGYVGQLTADELKNGKCGLTLDHEEMIGRGGIEEYFDCDLRGVDGRRLVEVDAKGRYVRELGSEEPVKGKDINLSLDAYWQEKIYKLLNGRKASVVMSDPRTGKIIALVSSPGFDANAFSQQNNLKIKEYLSDKVNLPLLNRADGVRYGPGSVFKIVMSAAGLEAGVIDQNTLIEDTGIIKIGDYSYSNWLYSRNGGTDGMVNIVKAIKRSNDIFFYKLGEKLGVDNIKFWANQFGYGQKTGVELVGENAGLVPDNQWKKDVKGESWYLGDTYHLSIGQGFLGVTPLQVNQTTNVIATNGTKCKMSILKDSSPECQKLNIKSSTIATIKEGMLEACHSGGTAWPLFNFKTTLACKTGTAEVGDGSKDTHAWLTAYGPVENPEVSITVMVERGGEGSDVAAPIVGDILKEWFNQPNTLVPRYSDIKSE